MISRTDRINEMVRLLMHRFYVRAIRRDPWLLDAAREMINTKLRQSPARFLTLWRDFLKLPNDDICRILLSYHDNAVWLRQSSPLGRVIPKEVVGLDYANPDIRRKVWHKSALMVDFLLRRWHADANRRMTGSMFSDMTISHQEPYEVSAAS